MRVQRPITRCAQTIKLHAALVSDYHPWSSVCMAEGKRSPGAVPGTGPGVGSRWKATSTDDNADKTACN